jgi:lipoprotein-anchoring transpeptidase ErfK/SrfK
LASADRRGTVEVGTRLPLLGRVGGDGCSVGAWARVGLDRYICEEHVQYRRAAAWGRRLPEVAEGEILPYRYAFVRFDATPTYAQLDDYDAGLHFSTLGEGFGVIVTDHVEYAGVPFAVTRRGLFVERASLGFARGSPFVGQRLAPGEPPIAWIRRPGADVRETVGSRRAIRRAGPRAVVHLARPADRGFVPLADGGVVPARDLHVVNVVARPDGVASKERWIDIDVSEQVLVAYEGDQPVYATLVSTGRPGQAVATPLGVFRVWVKLAYSDMDDLERDDLESNYAIERVPWVQYFEGANGLHAAFWHDDFGRRRSHGCVNLSPRDARFLFEFTSPRLPDGWQAIFPTSYDPGTVIRVRE